MVRKKNTETAGAAAGSDHSIAGLIEQLRGAVSALRAGDMAQAAARTDQIRDLSYDLPSRLAAFHIRATCGALDATICGAGTGKRLTQAEQEIDKLATLLEHGGQGPCEAGTWY